MNLYKKELPQFISTPIGVATNYGYHEIGDEKVAYYGIFQNDRAVTREIPIEDDMQRAVRKAFMYV